MESGKKSHDSSGFPPNEQEKRLDVIFGELEGDFKRLEKLKEQKFITKLLKEITAKLKEAKTLIKDFEREARVDGMPAKELAERKRNLVNDLNNYIAMKKMYGASEEQRAELLAGQKEEVKAQQSTMAMDQLMKVGRRDMADTNAALNRAEKVLDDTIQVGTQINVELQSQGEKLNKMVDDLNDIEFNLKKASLVIRDITRGLLTDKCIGFLLLLAVIGVIGIIVVKVINPNKKTVTNAINNAANATQGAINSSPAPASGRRLLYFAVQAALEDGSDY